MDCEKTMNDILLNIVKNGGKQAWIGNRPVFEMDIIELITSTNFRVSPRFHQQYDVVWFFEHLLSDLHPLSWKIALDECIRLIGEAGKIVIRCRENQYFTIPLLKQFLGRKFDTEVSIASEHPYKDRGFWIIVFDIQRKNLEKYKSELWTFAILTNGKKDSIVEQYLYSIRKHDTEKKHEIIVCGSNNHNFKKYNVCFVEEEFRDDQLAEISKKKNIIADMAQNDNICIVHDRYILDDNFFNGFQQYGYDFSFLTIKQYFENRSEYPSYSALPNRLLWQNPIKVDNYDFLYENTFLNGGLLIFKTHILKEIPFNNTLHWNQQEDVEIANTYMNHGIVPRINFFSSATTVGVGQDKISTFQQESIPQNIFYNPWGIDYSLQNLKKQIPEKFEAKLRKKIRAFVYFLYRILKKLAKKILK